MATTISTNLGVGSGLPLEKILTDLRNVENVALQRVQNRYNAEDQRLSAYGTLKGAVESFQKAAAELAKDTTYGTMKAVSSNDAVGVSAKNTAIAGQYTIKVTSLATSQTLVSKGIADRAATIDTAGASKITFTLQDGSTKALTLPSGNLSLNDLVTAINSDADLGINATIINDGNPSSPFRLLLSTKDTGEQSAITGIAVDQPSALQDLLNIGTGDNDLQVRQEASNAEFTINGVNISKQSNEITDAIEGVSLTLSKAENATSTITISRDDATANKSITAFVNAYNAIQTTIKALTTYDVDTQTASVLTGDSMARSVQSQMRNTLSVFGQGEIGSLADLGITTDPVSGLLKIDNDKVTAALKDNLGDVKSLLMGENGLAAKVQTITDTFLNSKGYFATSQAGIEKTLKNLKKEYERTELRIEEKMAGERAKFVALDKAVAQMSSVSSYLTTQLAMLNNLSSSNNSSS